jgi:glycine cleavage system regulatory protein
VWVEHFCHQRPSLNTPNSSSVPQEEVKVPCRRLPLNTCLLDERGIVHKVSKAIATAGGTISDSRWAVLGGEFAMLILAAFPETSVGNTKQAKDLIKVNFPNFTVSAQFASDKAAQTEPLAFYRVTAAGPDMPGLLRDFTQHFEKHGISVEDLATVSILHSVFDV